MEKIHDGYFYNPTRGNLLLEQAMEEMVSYMAEKPDRFYDIIVGCDSSSEEQPNFPLVVAILRVGEGGRFFLKKVTYPAGFSKRFESWRARILQEVLLSCELALFLRENFNKKIQSLPNNGFNYQIRYIHADIGEQGQTKDMIKELTGLIIGNGFEPKIKPESCIASTLADRYS
jgi:predicted RNase H-related nuclease YkuK (DUF458 family)